MEKYETELEWLRRVNDTLSGGDKIFADDKEAASHFVHLAGEISNRLHLIESVDWEAYDDTKNEITRTGD